MRSRVASKQPEQPQKWRRSSTSTGSSSSGLTHVDNAGGGENEEVPEFEKFTIMQKELWDLCTTSFVFGMQTYPVDIVRCIMAKDEYIIRKMEAKSMKSVKVELVQIGDILQRHKICLTPVDDEGKLL
jgi:hypothetical protein